ncbi:hypothetical protein V2590_11565 [Tenacibaculum maritimum]|uniref:hypothetical protein n=1 Tax=Tenacibaculum maritimum TaxID=107401 RepID=UPI0038778304
MSNTTFTRKQLYDLVWSKPLTKLAKEYAISDNGLRKICKKHNIPLPQLGHWQKLQYGKKVSIISLPKHDGNILIELKARKEGEKEIHGGLSDYQILKRQLENDKSINLTVPEKITKYDSLIVLARKDLKSKEPSNWGNSIGLVNSSKGILNIEVSKVNISRSLRFMDTLIKVFKRKGFEIKFDRGTCVVVNGEPIKIRLRESLKKVKIDDNDWKRFDLKPSGVLTFRLEDLYPERQWKDSDKNPLETKISSIVTTIELRAKEEKKKRIKREEWHKQYEIEREKEEEFKRLKEKELSDFKKLFNSATRYHKTKYIRDYIDSFESFAIQNNSLNDESKKWIQWARDKADWYDPFIEKEDNLLKSIDKDNLNF